MSAMGRVWLEILKEWYPVVSPMKCDESPKTSLSVRIFAGFRGASEMSPNTAASQAVECCAPIPFVKRHATDKPNAARPRGPDASILSPPCGVDGRCTAQVAKSR